jgi:hypothetical protein
MGTLFYQQRIVSATSPEAVLAFLEMAKITCFGGFHKGNAFAHPFLTHY